MVRCVKFGRARASEVPHGGVRFGIAMISHLVSVGYETSFPFSAITTPLAYKKAVAEWGAKNFKADVGFLIRTKFQIILSIFQGFAVMCGVMYGADGTSAHAYNMFIIGDKMDTVLFLE